MEIIKIDNLNFKYPASDRNVLENIGFSVNRGEFVTLCGKSGCGKTTLLRLMKSSLAPFGELSGDIYFDGLPLSEYDSLHQAAHIGFVMQNPENQIVTDKVWHELSFGLESLGLPTPEIRAKVAEMASFFGIQTWFHRSTTELSGGQKQLLNLASIMVMQPELLILDEPLSQLDPIAAEDFLGTLKKINSELGTTVIIAEHHLDDVFSVSDRVIVMDSGHIIADDEPKAVCRKLMSENHDMIAALPTPTRIFGALGLNGQVPLTVREGRACLEDFCAGHAYNPGAIPKKMPQNHDDNPVIDLRDVWFRYEKDLPDTVKNLNLKIYRGEIFALVGGNGTGKTTALSLICGLLSPTRGKISINGKNLSEIGNTHGKIIAMLPQNPQDVFVKKTVYLDLEDMLTDKKLANEEKSEMINSVASLCRIEKLLESHPYDLSGGEQHRAALAKLLLLSPEILLLDEPTNGMDSHFKAEFADILEDLKTSGVTILLVSHDVEFCAEHADRCALFFDGGIISVGTAREFFDGKSFYTTAANRMARAIIPNAVLTSDVIAACGGEIPMCEKKPCVLHKAQNVVPQEQKKKAKPEFSIPRIVLGIIFTLFFLITALSLDGKFDPLGLNRIAWPGTVKRQIISIAEAGIAILCFLPKGKKKNKLSDSIPYEKKSGKRTIVAAVSALFAIPLTIFVGIYCFGDRKYYAISLLIIFETIIPFLAAFESRKPRARELVIISVLCALGVAGRTAFYMLPQFKPVAAIVIISGICFGGETGFLVGAITAFVSNFFFGQGPWTPWQMFAFGIVGFLAGVIFKKEMFPKTRLTLCIFGFLATFAVYGGIMNLSTVIQTQANPNLAMYFATCVSGAPFDLIHAISTVFFLWFTAEPMVEKLERVKTKYGLL